ncbi:helix-turn-helix domain-containing protein [Chitinophaga pinensis]|uniref:Transcriptional regulator, AraC family n=1 Tax=Chitinophaga pinensis (strain ATCC 43595 / DSM 2588 / LMG 13176 / NBRC 15968 / NCIMB 11800 / UQM 2034) TaxID=485918 RepID=A0A979GA90_CHIPD|nr:helix-turn-helix transcriptional regulator [Chitinophaga pinensis]ACU63505.1 transcriptional regulator, AraC family [Chitinophaga pinensis DSM 2588]
MQLVVFAALHFELDACPADDKPQTTAPFELLLQLIRTKQVAVAPASTHENTDGTVPPVTISPSMMRYLDHVTEPIQGGQLPGYALQHIGIELLTEYQEKQVSALSAETALDTTMMLIRNEVMLYPNIHVHSLRSLAKKHFINEKSLSRTFVKTFGIKISDFILEQVMQRAKYLLENTDMTVADIAEELGYSNDYNFSRTFKNMYSVYPAIFRKKEPL